MLHSKIFYVLDEAASVKVAKSSRPQGNLSEKFINFMNFHTLQPFLELEKNKLMFLLNFAPKM